MLFVDNKSETSAKCTSAPDAPKVKALCFCCLKDPLARYFTDSWLIVEGNGYGSCGQTELLGGSFAEMLIMDTSDNVLQTV